MSKSNLKIVMGLLPKLSAAELRSAKLSVDFLLKGSPQERDPGESSGDDGDAEIRFDMYAEALRRVGISCPKYHSFKRLDIFKHYQRHGDEISPYIEENFGKQNRRNRMKLYRIFAELIIQWMGKTGVPMKIGLFFKNLSLTPELVNSAFPGYAEQGWLPLILTLGDRSSGCDVEEETD